MKEKVRLGIIGCGGRGVGVMKLVLIPMMKDDVIISGLCDTHEDRMEKAAQMVVDAGGERPKCSLDYHDILNMDEVDAILVMTGWEEHVMISVDAMLAGKPVAMEVGGAYSLEECWRLVRTSEMTGIPCMMLENCCYGQRETMALNMAKKGFFGDIVYCEGGYCHDLRMMWTEDRRFDHYRPYNYERNCDNYPTHELGPIAKILNINNGNRMLTLTSMASSAKGARQYILDQKGPEDPMMTTPIRLGDIIKTEIKCAGGELITLTLDTTLPRHYSRNFTVRGTKAGYWEMNDSIFLEGDEHKKGKDTWGTAEKYVEEWQHPMWKDYVPTGGHDGMDWMVCRAFIEAVKAGVQTPIDVYDTASWMCISALSEQSIAMGGAPQAIPDFTNGRWIKRLDIVDQPYGLNSIYEK